MSQGISVTFCEWVGILGLHKRDRKKLEVSNFSRFMLKL